jgi:hypothetical protein
MLRRAPGRRRPVLPRRTARVLVPRALRPARQALVRQRRAFSRAGDTRAGTPRVIPAHRRTLHRITRAGAVSFVFKLQRSTLASSCSCS